MPKSDMLDTMEDRVQLDQRLLMWWRRRQKAERMARSRNRAISLEGQIILAREYATVMPLRLRRLPVDARGKVTDIMPISSIRPKTCNRCGLNNNGRCKVSRCPYEKISGQKTEVRCKAVCRV